MPFLDRELKEIERHVLQRESLNITVSEVDVAWHLDHMLKAINKIYDILFISNPNDYKWNLNIARMFVFATGKIIRGVGSAPKVALPPEKITAQDIHEQLKEAKQKLTRIDSLDPNSSFLHPYFGRLNKKQSKKFLKIHTIHHLKIIEDILKESG